MLQQYHWKYYFQSLLQALDSCYPIPGRTLIGKEIDKVLIDMKDKIGIFFSQSEKINLCADIWSKKGMTSSYLGITGHFFHGMIKSVTR